MTSIPLVDLHFQHRAIAADLEQGLAALYADQAFVLGPPVAEFEREFARFCQVGHCVGVANGTDALELILRALDVGPGQEVILPANTFVATALAVLRAGARPLLVDQDPQTHLLDVAQVADRIGPRTRAVIAVHLYGQMAPLEALEPLTRAAGVALLEDAAQSQGARRHGRCAGSVGLAAGTSFYPSKNLGAYGDAGAILSDDAGLAERARQLRNYGSDVRNHHPLAGFNSRLDSLQAVVLRAKLRHLAAWNQERCRAAARYAALLVDLPDLELPVVLAGNEPVWHLYVVRVPQRDRVLKQLREGGIGAAIHYPTPLHLQGALGSLGHRRGDFPEAERAAREVLSLPLFPGISAAQQERVADVLGRALR